MKRFATFAFAALLAVALAAVSFAGSTPAKDSKVFFGSYPQDQLASAANSQDKQPIEWRVLEVSGDKMLLLSEKILDAVPWHTTSQDLTVTWETSAIRAWLNGENSGQFYNEAFSTQDRVAIVKSNVKNPTPTVPSDCASSGNDTQDNVFLLSREEAINSDYGFSSGETADALRQKKPTTYAYNNGVGFPHVGFSPTDFPDMKDTYAETSTSNGRGPWYLRTRGGNSWAARALMADMDGYCSDYSFGLIVFPGERKPYISGAVPAIWIDTTKVDFTASGDQFVATAKTETAPTITTASLPDGKMETTYSASLAADGTATITWTLKSGSSLPAGLALASDGAITGTPTAAGKTEFTVVATNGAGSAEKALSITIAASVTPGKENVSGVGVSGEGMTAEEPVFIESSDKAVVSLDAQADGSKELTLVKEDGTGKAATFVKEAFVCAVKLDVTHEDDTAAMTLTLTPAEGKAFDTAKKYYAIIQNKKTSAYAVFECAHADGKLNITVKPVGDYFSENTVAVYTGTAAEKGGSSSGGCNAGFAGLLLLAVPAMVFVRKKK
ncbi:DUF6273 domain-containing protein [Cloacibacillus evryensis]|uniref:DUF6273 domain-containing protein n=1 Tax=Cloacibacillus evryensis TaxID=508460 RepID=A0AAW5KA58_9BACT|nr:DUF6273 domain-containing protein [Cloacibacillus evryensis]EHL66136.1 hypothetical protein HMPREF1006_02885 [Synergistes sp. 3_1_syn1]MCQ4815663.1 DUF6273 domain-containing protein [Cloacibacillus evryensis]